MYSGSNSTLTLINTIVAFSTEGGAGGGSGYTAECCDVYGNEGGNWVAGLEGLGVGDNIELDPLFCGAPGGDFTIRESSPCAPFSAPNIDCDLIGAREVGCPAIGLTIAVCSDGSGAYLTIQDALDAAVSGDTLELCCDVPFDGPGNRAIDGGGKEVVIRSECEDPIRCVIDCESAAAGFLYRNGEGSNAALEGVTITHGSATSGGGILCQGTSPSVSNCVVTGNYASERGGGMYCREGASPTITGCAFSMNEAVAGGGLSCVGSSSPRVTDCEFLDNEASDGGGLSCDHECTVEVRGSIFAGNYSSGDGGGVQSWDDSNLTLVNCTLYGNAASGSGGGMYSGSNSTLTLINTIVAFSTEGVAGGGSGYTAGCCDVYGNAGGNWVAGLEGLGGGDNIELDPLFCNAPADSVTLHCDSPCMPGVNPDCGLIGALPIGCPTSGAPDVREVPGAMRLGRITPNPGNTMMTFAFAVPDANAPEPMQLSVHDPMGRLVRILVDEALPAGRYQVRWDGTDKTGVPVESGVYFCRLRCRDASEARPVIVLR